MKKLLNCGEQGSKNWKREQELSKYLKVIMK